MSRRKGLLFPSEGKPCDRCSEEVGKFAAAMKEARRTAGSPDLGNLCAGCLYVAVHGIGKIVA